MPKEQSVPKRLRLSTIKAIEILAHPGQDFDGVIQELITEHNKYRVMVAAYTDDTPKGGE